MKFKAILEKDPNIREEMDLGRFDDIKPFGSIDWGMHVILTTPSLVRYDYPWAYIYRSVCRGIVIYSKQHRDEICLGEFYEMLTKSEQKEFRENIDRITKYIFTLN